MADRPKFLLGQGETLARDTAYRSRSNNAEMPYTLEVQRSHLRKLFVEQQQAFEALPAEACPSDTVVSMATLHPQFYSRTGFPVELLREARLRLIGSFPRNVKPRYGRGSKLANGVPSTVLFLAGTRSSFKKLTALVANVQSGDPIADDLLKIEKIEPQTAHERLQAPIGRREIPLELVLHFDADQDIPWEQQFYDYARKCGVKLKKDKTYQSRGLWFIAGEGNQAEAEKLAQFTFVRAIRPMPTLRPLEMSKVLRSSKKPPAIVLPSDGPLSGDCRVAVFDGGLPIGHPFAPWATAIEPTASDQIGSSILDYQSHGVAVTSALLFGGISSHTLARPYCHVDHYRALGDLTTDKNLYNVMLYIDRVLSSSAYEFVSLSIGPVEIVGEDKVSAWTTMLDDHFYQSKVLGAIAVGNDGELPFPSCRVQVPSDCVNALAVGAADSSGDGWHRAPYSCTGPGRAPGLIKPDVVHFGGADGNEFKVLVSANALAGTQGTSFATPSVMRVATAVRAHFGSTIGPLAIRALLVHCAEDGGFPRSEVGWGRAPSDVEKITVCPDGSVRILYQGTLQPTKVRRLPIPLPIAPLAGKVVVTATFCYLCQTDPHTPGDYTRAGLGVTFRPHAEKFDKPPADEPNKKPNPEYPSSRSFFEGVGKKSEQQLRSDAFKWDTIRHASDSMLGTSLLRPFFDIHYQARQPGRSASPSNAPALHYALVVTVSAPKNLNLYDDVVAAYPQLQPILPVVTLPVKASAVGV